MCNHNINKLLEILRETYPDAHCELNFRNPFELLIATILSAQTTDQKVNQVTAELFDQYPTAQEMLTITLSELEKRIRAIGLFRTKAKNILKTCKIIAENYKGEVPQSFDQLVELPGVGRKTAGVVLSNAFGIPAFPVDTHVLRVANRLGLTDKDDPFKVEKDLTALIPEEHWIDTHHQLIFHGRRMCSARNPRCTECPLANYCPTQGTGSFHNTEDYR
jgi:endonuclease-3